MSALTIHIPNAQFSGKSTIWHIHGNSFDPLDFHSRYWTIEKGGSEKLAHHLHVINAWTINPSIIGCSIFLVIILYDMICEFTIRI